jgi:hypothetical protein
MCKLTCCRNCLLLLFLLLFCRRRHHASFPNDFAGRTTQHNNQFGVKSAAPTALMPTMMLIVTLSEGYRQMPGTKPYVFLRRTQPTTNPQCPSTHCDLNGQLRLPWCLTPGNDAYNSCPEYWWIVVCGGAGSGAPWWPWDGGNRQGWRGTVWLALARFYLAKTLITTHNNQSIRPSRRCTDDNIIAGTGYHDKNQDP